MLLYPVNEIRKQFAAGDKMLRRRNNIESCGGKMCWCTYNKWLPYDAKHSMSFWSVWSDGSDDVDAYTFIDCLNYDKYDKYKIACQEIDMI